MNSLSFQQSHKKRQIVIKRMLGEHRASPEGMNWRIDVYCICLSLEVVYEGERYLLLKSEYVVLWVLLDAFFLENPSYSSCLIIHFSWYIFSLHYGNNAIYLIICSNHPFKENSFIECWFSILSFYVQSMLWICMCVHLLACGSGGE